MDNLLELTHGQKSAGLYMFLKKKKKFNHLNQWPTLKQLSIFRVYLWVVNEGDVSF